MPLPAIDAIARCPLFAQLGDADLEALARIAHERRYRAGETLFLANEAPAGLHVVTEGEVRVTVLSPRSGREIVLTIERPYQSVAELPSFDGGPYPAHATAVVETRTTFLPQAAFDQVLLERPTVARHLLRALGRRLRRLVALVEQISFQEVVHRLAAHLLERAGDGPIELDTNATIAAQLGTVPELVSRNLARLHQAGTIRLQQRRVEIVDVAALRELAADAGR
jgi:CRP-like cAMP-binding protein